MGNFISFHSNDSNRLYTILKFFFKKILLKNSLDTIYNPEDFLKCSKSIIDSVKDNTFESIKFQLHDDIFLFKDSDKISNLFLEKEFNVKDLNEIIRNLRIYDYENIFKFFNTESEIILSFSLISLEDPDDMMEGNHVKLINLRNKWVKEKRLPFTASLGIFGIII
jgi:hypothetical protein